MSQYIAVAVSALVYNHANLLRRWKIISKTTKMLKKTFGVLDDSRSSPKDPELCRLRRRDLLRDRKLPGNANPNKQFLRVVKRLIIDRQDWQECHQLQRNRGQPSSSPQRPCFLWLPGCTKTNLITYFSNEL